MAERRRFLDIIIKESERLTRLINQVLDLAKIESGKLEWKVSSVDLREVIDDSVETTSQLFQDKRVHVWLQMPDEVPRVTADFDRMMQVVINLLSNAVKFCEPGTWARRGAAGRTTRTICASTCATTAKASRRVTTG